MLRPSIRGPKMPPAASPSSRQPFQPLVPEDLLSRGRSLDLFWRAMACGVADRLGEQRPGSTVGRLFPNDRALEIVNRAATAPATTSTSGWASQLVTTV